MVSKKLQTLKEDQSLNHNRNESSKIIRLKTGMVITRRRRGEGEMETYSSTGIKFQLSKMNQC